MAGLHNVTEARESGTRSEFHYWRQDGQRPGPHVTLPHSKLPPTAAGRSPGFGILVPRSRSRLQACRAADVAP